MLLLIVSFFRLGSFPLLSFRFFLFPIHLSLSQRNQQQSTRTMLDSTRGRQPSRCASRRRGASWQGAIPTYRSRLGCHDYRIWSTKRVRCHGNRATHAHTHEARRRNAIERRCSLLQDVTVGKHRTRPPHGRPSKTRGALCRARSPTAVKGFPQRIPPSTWRKKKRSRLSLRRERKYLPYWVLAKEPGQ